MGMTSETEIGLGMLYQLQETSTGGAKSHELKLKSVRNRKQT